MSYNNNCLQIEEKNKKENGQNDNDLPGDNGHVGIL
jgi:hypothetical protein